MTYKACYPRLQLLDPINPSREIPFDTRRAPSYSSHVVFHWPEHYRSLALVEIKDRCHSQVLSSLKKYHPLYRYP